VLAPGKVNLCLLVGAPRAEDRLHPLVSLVQPTWLADEVTIEPAERDEVVCPGVSGENLAYTALTRFRDITGWDGPPQRITIAKRIPIAGGMAGGSSDAAAALALVSQASGLPIPPGLPMALGADVPVMLGAARALMTGAGEHVEPLPGAAPPLVIVALDAHLTAAQVYREFDAHDTPRTPEELERAAQRIRDGDIPRVNDLEPAARRLCPLIGPALDALREAGIEHPMVSGSGPTVFGLSDDPEAVDRLRAAGYERAVAA
jgi:4-diphosphocytidyl-2-C-methyl-D-erythritol kinase